MKAGWRDAPLTLRDLVVSNLQVSRIIPRLWRWVYKSLRLPIKLSVERGVVVMTIGSQSGESHFKTYE